MAMPERITVTRTYTYDVAQAIADIRLISEHPDPNNLEIDLEEVLEYLEDWIYDDMRSPISRHELAYFDENGNEI